MAYDYDVLRLNELEDFSRFLHGLTDEQWDGPSLCEGWRVRDVVSHITIGYTTPMPRMLRIVAGYRFNVPKASKEESIAFGSSHTPAELLQAFDPIWQAHVRKGIAKLIKTTESLVDHVVHQQDCRRPLGLPREVPGDRLRAALDVAPNLSGFVGAKARAAGLRLEATDLDWSWGDGPVVRGAGEALLLALCGRPVALADLDGEGMATLRSRVAPSAPASAAA